MGASENVRRWSQTAASNASADSGITLNEYQFPGTLNDACRSMMAAIAKWRDDLSGSLLTTGTSTVYAVTTNTGYTSLTDGLTVCVRVHLKNTGASTLNLDNLGAKKIRKMTANGEEDLSAGDVVADGRYFMHYAAGADSGGGAWVITNAAGGRSLGENSTGDFLTTGTLYARNFMFDADSARDTGWQWVQDGVMRAVANNVEIVRIQNGTLEIKKDVNITGQMTLASTANYITFNDTDWGNRYIHANGGTIGFLNSSGGWNFNVDNSGNMWAAGNVTAGSDIRFKENILQIEDAIPVIEKIKGVRFTRKQDKCSDMGVIAQDVQAVAPELVRTDRDGYLAVNYMGMSGLFIEAIRELHARLKALEEKTAKRRK